MTLGDLIRDRRDEIVDRWIAGLGVRDGERRTLETRGAAYLDRIGASLRERPEISSAAEMFDRLPRVDFLSFPVVADTRRAIAEYKGLRDAIFEVSEEAGVPLSYPELRRLLDAMGAAFAADAVQDAERERELFFQTIPDLLCIGNFQGRFVRVNPAFSRVLGWSDEEMYARPFIEFVHPDDREDTLLDFQRLVRGESVSFSENRYRTKRGDYRRLSWSVSPVVEKGILYAVARDVTDRRRIERERAEALAILDSVVETVPVGLAFFDREGRYIRVNAALARLNGRPAEAHAGKRIREVVPELDDELDPVIQRVFATKKAKLGNEVSLRRTGAQEDEHQLVSFFPVVAAHGEVQLVGVVVVDITERKRTTERLQVAAEFRERFVGVVAHDLRTPLASIITGAQLLERMEDMPERASRTARRIASTAQRTAKMIGDLMDFTRVRLGTGIPVERAPCDLAATVRQVVDETGAVYPGRTIRWDAEGRCVGRWDGNRLAQMVGNLLKNALDYSPADTAVEVLVSRRGGAVELSVRNRNKGDPIPAASVPSLFEPFHRGDSQMAKGLGLGLYIANEIARAHGGRIDVRSGREEGTCFTVVLPVG